MNPFLPRYPDPRDLIPGPEVADSIRAARATARRSKELRRELRDMAAETRERITETRDLLARQSTHEGLR